MNILHCISWEIESFMPFIDVMFDCIVNLWYIDVSLRLFLDFQLISSSIAPYMGMNILHCCIVKMNYLGHLMLIFQYI